MCAHNSKKEIERGEIQRDTERVREDVCNQEKEQISHIVKPEIT